MTRLKMEKHNLKFEKYRGGGKKKHKTQLLFSLLPFSHSLKNSAWELYREGRSQIIKMMWRPVDIFTGVTEPRAQMKSLEMTAFQILWDYSFFFFFPTGCWGFLIFPGCRHAQFRIYLHNCQVGAILLSNLPSKHCPAPDLPEYQRCTCSLGTPWLPEM